MRFVSNQRKVFLVGGGVKNAPMPKRLIISIHGIVLSYQFVDHLCLLEFLKLKFHYRYILMFIKVLIMLP